ncbi:MAG: YtxH domain-containing protein [Armatimonadota bacterium]
MANNSRGFLFGFLVGAVLGAAVALLYAPVPGSEARELVGRKASEVAEKSRQLFKKRGKPAEEEGEAESAASECED